MQCNSDFGTPERNRIVRELQEGIFDYCIICKHSPEMNAIFTYESNCYSEDQESTLLI